MFYLIFIEISLREPL